jgi:Carboxypeptidase regulatory-like domain
MEVSRKQFSLGILAGLVLAAAAYAQDFRANLLGQVVDPSRTPIANVKVTATKDDTNVSRGTVTNAEGIYTLVGLDPGATR